MTAQTITPLRRRMTEDISARGRTAGMKRGYIHTDKDITAFFQALSSLSGCGGPSALSGSHEIERVVGNHDEHRRLGLLLLVPGDAGPG